MRIFIGTLLLASAVSFPSFAQDQQQNVSACSDNVMHSELVSLDNSLEQQGFRLEQFKLMNMPSGSYVPVAMHMEAGAMYQINFLASKNYQQYHLTIIDKDRQKLVDKKVKQKSGDHHYVSQSFVAPYSGNFIIVLSQKVKGQREACGGLSVLKAGKGTSK